MNSCYRDADDMELHRPRRENPANLVAGEGGIEYSGGTGSTEGGSGRATGATATSDASGTIEDTQTGVRVGGDTEDEGYKGPTGYGAGVWSRSISTAGLPVDARYGHSNG